MLEIALITLSILLFCGLPVGIPLAICSIVEAVCVLITYAIAKKIKQTEISKWGLNPSP